ncbi:cell division protein FtsZ [Paraconexibacter antarcticus]|uniref:Cell division protein FtsZ n=2 Tax=Paraconexibacter antarcticus TaxID=2949664 RepID=A0ABY5DWS7_9ACTN|nr:cell division protein FtsZ [Paraconexibacter antarcticus]UTI66471.1 cell division protein FtsZ [Paraconexibacter antarcticus]
MESGKRASMREGPLAALFRKTDEVQEEQARREAQGGASAPSTAAARQAAPPLPVDSRETPGFPHPAMADPRADAPAAAPEAEARNPYLPPAAPAPAPARPAAPQRPNYSSYEDPYARSSSPQPPAWGQAMEVGKPVIRVVGVGGAGVNAVNRMVEAGIEGIEFIAVNTDVQSLQQSTADITLHIGPQITRGLGAGSNPDLGRAAAMEEYDRIKSLLKGSDMIFIAAGAGGGTGTGAAPVVARISRELGALTVGIVTKPFGFEGSRRAGAAEVGIQSLSEEVDTLIVVPNNRLLSVLDKHTSMVEAFTVADDVLRQGVQGISDLVTLPGLINLDFADVRTIMSEAGNALLGIGMGRGENRALEAAAAAVASPLLETSMEGARKILLSITSGTDLSLWEVNEAAKTVAAAAHPEANIIFGAMVDEKLDDEVWITVVATGYGPSSARSQRRPLEEPAGEVRVQRRTEPAQRRSEPRGTATRRTGLGVSELDVPEFMPRG